MSKLSDRDYQKSKPQNKSNLFTQYITIHIMLINQNYFDRTLLRTVIPTEN